MKVHIEVGELVLHGFDYPDKKLISASMEEELIKLFSNSPRLESSANGIKKFEINETSFRAIKQMNPKVVGIEVARSIFRTFEASRDKIGQRKNRAF